MMDLGALGDRLRRVTVEVTSEGRAVGAGVVWAPGWVVTNAHVIRQPRAVVRLPDDRRADGRVVARSRDADLAVLLVPDLGLPAATSADSDTLRVGSLVIAIGHPLGTRGALATGVVHAVGPITPEGRPWIQADLRLAPGNSGGPLADARGHLLGLNAMIVGGLALAIPVGEVKRFVRAAGLPIA
jgi:serine protease Do